MAKKGKKKRKSRAARPDPAPADRVGLDPDGGRPAGDSDRESGSPPARGAQPSGDSPGQLAKASGSPETGPAATADRIAVIAMVLALGGFLFASLGQRALWDDEANTALFGQGVWRTGDMTARIDHNVVAYRYGAELDDELRNRYLPPLPYYVVAPFAGLAGVSPFWVRLPFAVVAFACVLLIARWLLRAEIDARLRIVFSLAMSGSVAFVLYGRQSRYYALAMLLSVIIVYVYAHRRDSWRTILALAIAGAALVSTNYLPYGTLAVVVGIDYLIWGRKRMPIPLPKLAVLLASQLAITGLVVSIWNPFDKNVIPYDPPSWIGWKLKLLWMQIRDLNGQEFVCGPVALLAPVAIALRWPRWRFVGRLGAGICLYVAITALLSPQPGTAVFADVRYMCALIPALVLLSALVIASLPIPSWAAYALAGLAFHTTALHTPLSKLAGEPSPEFGSTTVSLIKELSAPPPGPFRAASQWFNKNAIKGSHIWVVPDWPTYSLMFHAPEFVYAWQFKAEDQKRIKLPPIHFENQRAPHYVVIFGDFVNRYRTRLKAGGLLGVKYREIAVLPVAGIDKTRPEIRYHSFEQETDFDPEDEAVYIFAKPNLHRDMKAL